jgi:hypothetical protein
VSFYFVLPIVFEVVSSLYISTMDDIENIDDILIFFIWIDDILSEVKFDAWKMIDTVVYHTMIEIRTLFHHK